MTFLNGLLALGAIAAVLPLAIHLLHRQRFEIVDWAAMHLIAAVQHANQRRWRWQEFLLLLVRCAIPILLALALARPVLTAWRAVGGGQPSTTIVLLDDSASMRRSMPDGINAFDEARRRIAIAFDQSAAGSEANIVLSGGEFQDLTDIATTDLDGLLDSLDRLEPSSGALDLRGAGQSAMNQLVAASNPWRRLLILSDFSADDWQTGGSELASQFEEAFGDLPLPPEVTLLPIISDRTHHNLAVASLDSPVQQTVIGQEIPLHASISRHGDTDEEVVRGHWSVDGVRHAATQSIVQPGGLTSLDGSFVFSEPGTHRIRFEIESADTFSIDDYRDWIVFVDSATHVLLVDGNPSDQPLAGETDFLSIALSPFALARDSRIDTARTRVVTTKGFDADSLQRADVVVLANVRELDDPATDQLLKFVSNGGQLAIFLGDRVNVEWYNRLFEQKNGDALLPIRLNEQAVDAEPPLGLEIVPGSEILQSLLEVVGSRFEGVDVRRYHGFEWATDADDRPRSDVLVRLTDGKPYLIQGRWGHGVIRLSAGPADADWSSLPARPVFLPLVQNLIGRKVFGLDRALNVPSGGSLVDFFETNPNEELRAAEIQSADGNPVKARVDSVGRYAHVRSAPIRVAGNATIQYGEETTHVANVYLPESESRLNPLTDQQLETLAKSFGGTLVTDARSLEELGNERRYGREVWQWLLIAVTGFLLFEIFWQQHIGKVNRPLRAKH